ncbi:hypothetical protein OS493_039329, partial [Desmophyllum pertusum]
MDRSYQCLVFFSMKCASGKLPEPERRSVNQQVAMVKTACLSSPHTEMFCNQSLQKDQ